jgi:hypothetical protein
VMKRSIVSTLIVAATVTIILMWALCSLCIWDQNTWRTILSAFKIGALCRNDSSAFMIEAQWNIPDATCAF